MNTKENRNSGRKRKKSKGQNKSNTSHEKSRRKLNESIESKKTTATQDMNEHNNTMSTFGVSPSNDQQCTPRLQRPEIQHIQQQNQITPNIPMGEYYVSSPFQHLMNPVMHSTMNQGHDINSKIDKLVQCVDQMFQKLYVVDQISAKLDTFETKINGLIENVDKLSNRMNNIEGGLNEVKIEQAEMKSATSNLQRELNQGMATMKQNYSELFERHLDLQTRSMRDNLVFAGLPVSESDDENTESLLIEFMKKELKLNDPPDFHRAHRFGGMYEVNVNGELAYRSRNIVCRFKNFKGREIVRNCGRLLKGSSYGIREQFPKEINERRKFLWPYFKEAKIQKKKVSLKRDKLYIDGREFNPPNERQGDNEMVVDSQTRYDFEGARPKKRNGLNQRVTQIGPQNRHDK
ncbi:hypothetical protein SNE40_018341 [Patella caerulea]|uniref:Uncharacterized protein n=1 Tax=Patella caerulea TaxID=87958 RepID=A0AAN8JB02_PATCE